MVKSPRPGRVKTRLGRDIGMTASAWWFRHQVASLLRRMQDPRWDIVLAVAPNREGMLSRVWPAHIARWPQGQGDLGDRMRRMLNRARGPACLIGADIPDIQPHHIARAFKALGNHDAVFGPAPDGGFWLIGARRLSPKALTDVRWSTEHALADTVSTLPDWRISHVSTLRDVDTVDDLQ